MEIIKGDLVKAFIDGDVDVLIHQANCFHTFGSGIARQIREKIPEAYQADLRTGKGSKAKLGMISYHIWQGPYPKAVFNLYGQYAFGGAGTNTNYKALTEGLVRVRDMVNCMEMVTGEQMVVGLPRIGCGLGGGDWSIVSVMIQDILGDKDVVIYEF